MRLWSFLTGVALLGLMACGEPETSGATPAEPSGVERTEAVEPSQADIEAARGAAKALGTRLKGKLMAAMSEGGPTAAIDVCAEQAPLIASEVSEETGYEVGRTALRTRNTKNAPDDWERAQLLAFAEELAAGEEAASLETAAITGEKGEREFRWAKPILLEGPCAMCHGENVSPEVTALIAEHYPEDEATGFKVGELRGMFTVRKKIDG